MQVKCFAYSENLKRVARVIGGQVRNKHEWFAGSLLVVLHRELTGAYGGHVQPHYFRVKRSAGERPSASLE
jgi:hypothetical protein